jgi:hypothetical protein
MADSIVLITEVRFVFEAELTQVYVHITNPDGDAPYVVGWHHKAFPASKSMLDILGSKEFLDHLMWGLEAPE